MNFKLITFDFTGTLMRFKFSPAIVYTNVAKVYGININDHDLISGGFKTAFKEMNRQHPNFGAQTQLPWPQWWMQVIKKTFFNAGVVDNSLLDAVGWHLIKLYSTQHVWDICPGVVNILSLLKEQDIKLGVISNFDPRLENILLDAGLLHYFDFVLCSYTAGFSKPDQRIFEAALKQLHQIGMQPSQCCHVGDTFETDYVGALQSGWNGYLVNSFQHDNSLSYTLKSIEELKEHIFADTCQYR